MIRTVVCTRDGCSGNGFRISMQNGKLKTICIQCGAIYEYDTNFYDYNMLSNCRKCNSHIFKVFKDTENNNIYVKCNECGSLPEKIYIDPEGIQITYEERLLQEIKYLMQKIDQRISNVEIKTDSLEKGQELLEESLAYVNKYITNLN